jgi:eukaryotic-like serine/threonine-protein kinase
MASDLTPVMSAEDRQRSEQLSLPSRRPPTVVPGYDLERLLGEGAFGEVWVAMDRNTNCRVAIKFYSHRGSLDWSLLSREVEKLRFLRADRYVVQLLEVGWNATPPFYVMEYMERGSLEEGLEHGLPSVAGAVALARDVAKGLVHAHAKGILHCDLKPANILLDQDSKPRLADFGQSRLTHEQNPALGTLFYMAPEQADLKAVPDARWDVYALGALLYRLLTGQPPCRTEEGAADIQKAPNLEDRLRRYRQFINRSPRPTAHRQVPGVDRRLADIIDRCLALKPENRFPNAQAVLDALNARAVQHARRPLVILGVLGPALLVLIIAFFAWRGFETAVEESDHALTTRALLSNRFAARFAAAAVARRISQRWGILEQEAAKEEFHDLIHEAAFKGPDQQERQWLQKWLDRRRAQYAETTDDNSWFFDDYQGELLAVSPLEKSKDAIGKKLAHRSYFHGGDRDFTPEEMKTLRVKPTTHPTQSIVFESSADDKPRIVVFSVPVVDKSGGPLGVLAMGVGLGSFSELRPNHHDGRPAEADERKRWAVLVETRKDWQGRTGLILQHPWLAQLEWEKRQAPKVYMSEELVERFKKLGPIAQSKQEPSEEEALFKEFQDPVRAASAGDSAPWSPEYAGPWLAAAEPVIIPPRKDGDPIVDTGWVAIVEEGTADALQPVRELRGQLLVQGLETLAMLVVVMAALWGFVTVFLNESSRSRVSAFLRRRGGVGTSSGSAGTGRSASQPRSDASGGSAGNKARSPSTAPSAGVADPGRATPTR